MQIWYPSEQKCRPGLDEALVNRKTSEVRLEAEEISRMTMKVSLSLLADIAAILEVRLGQMVGWVDTVRTVEKW